jgi:hypothetical protein
MEKFYLLQNVCTILFFFAPINNYGRPLSFAREGLQVQWPRLLSALNGNLYTSIYVNTTFKISKFTQTVQRLQSHYLHTEVQRDVENFIGGFLQMKAPTTK